LICRTPALQKGSRRAEVFSVTISCQGLKPNRLKTVALFFGLFRQLLEPGFGRVMRGEHCKFEQAHLQRDYSVRLLQVFYLALSEK
jgi:hypothetical protein